MTVSAAKRYVGVWHRHSSVPQGGLWAVACALPGKSEPCGVAIVGRPVARMLQDGATCEVIRVATDGTRNACSYLYGLCRRIAQTMGYTRVLTYTLASESGASLRAAGANVTATVRGRSWNCESRPRIDKSESQTADKVRWSLTEATP